MTDAEELACANQALAKWQKRLHLDAWQIIVRVEEPAKGFEGMSVRTEWVQHTAQISVQSDYPTVRRTHVTGDETDAQLIEKGIVHELLHVCEQPLQSQFAAEIEWAFGEPGDRAALIGLPGRTLWRDYQEHWVNRLTRILIDADRSGGWMA